MTTPSTVGFIGVGNMGEPMAANLLRAGHPVWVHDRDAGKTLSLVAAGAHRAYTLAEAVAPADVVITMVRNDDELTKATLGPDGILEHLRPGAVHLSTSTVGPKTLEQVAAEYQQHLDLATAYQQQGRADAFVAATVLGRPKFAAAADLTIMLAGPAEARGRLLPLLEVLGAVTEFGDRVEAAAYAKLVCNYLLAAGMAVMGEAAAFAQACGIDPVQLLGMLAGSRSFLQGLGGYADKIAHDDHDEVRFPPSMGQKDIGLFLDAAKGAGAPMPIATIVLELLNEAARLGWADRDWSVLARVPLARAGVLAAPVA
jgi:3-hydroxyisobutyrate dehydrogenase-like beta-hydroxyacid dehydrogenase